MRNRDKEGSETAWRRGKGWNKNVNLVKIIESDSMRRWKQQKTRREDGRPKNDKFRKLLMVMVTKN